MSSKIEVSRELALTLKVTKEQEEDILRFFDTCEDNQGYDVPKPRMKSLARLGVIRSTGFSRYEITAAGDSLIEKLCEPAAPVVERQPVVECGSLTLGGIICKGHSGHDGPCGFNADSYTAPPELAELQARCDKFMAADDEMQATIARLTADLASANADKEAYAQNAIDLRTKLEKVKAASKQLAELDDGTIKTLGERLKGGQGEPVAFEDWFKKEIGDPDEKNCKGLESRDVYVARKAWNASQPAPVSVVLPERKIYDNKTSTRDYVMNCGWNACLDKVKELNQ